MLTIVNFKDIKLLPFESKISSWGYVDFKYVMRRVVNFITSFEIDIIPMTLRTIFSPFFIFFYSHFKISFVDGWTRGLKCSFLIIIS